MNRYILLTILGLLLCLNIYICWRLWRITPGIWAVKAAVVFIYIMWMTLMFVSFIHIEKMPLRMARIAYSVGNTWLIAFLYLLLAFITTRIVILFRLLPVSFLKDSPHDFSYMRSVIHETGQTCPRWVWPLNWKSMPAF
jgi:hypothetical protein